MRGAGEGLAQVQGAIRVEWVGVHGAEAMRDAGRASAGERGMKM